MLLTMYFFQKLSFEIKVQIFVLLTPITKIFFISREPTFLRRLAGISWEEKELLLSAFGATDLLFLNCPTCVSNCWCSDHLLWTKCMLPKLQSWNRLPVK